jgi:5-methyltetrahydropteroyltriglutamate--homocysteine methyltransferase
MTTNPPFRADHVGSLLRPQRLHEARAKFQRDEIPRSALTEVENECIQEVVQMQENVGLKGVTDGEFRRKIWHYDFLTGLEGIEEKAEHQGPAFKGGFTLGSLVTTSKISNPNGIMLDHFQFLKASTRVTPKFCIPSPSLAYHRGGRALIDQSAYPDLDLFWQDLTTAYRAELKMLYEQGCRYLQLDDTTFAMLCDPKIRNQMVERGDEPSGLIEQYARTITSVLAERPADLTVTVHMCRGNALSSWLAEGGYEPVAETLFGGVKVDGFFMEWDTDRSGDFEPLRFAPQGKKIVLGLVSSKFPELEPKDELKRRIDEAAKYVPLENLCISPQCGFASTVEGNLITADDQWRKLSLLVETAEEVWGSV